MPAPPLPAPLPEPNPLAGRLRAGRRALAKGSPLRRLTAPPRRWRLVCAKAAPNNMRWPGCSKTPLLHFATKPIIMGAVGDHRILEDATPANSELASQSPGNRARSTRTQHLEIIARSASAHRQAAPNKQGHLMSTLELRVKEVATNRFERHRRPCCPPRQTEAAGDVTAASTSAPSSTRPSLPRPQPSQRARPSCRGPCAPSRPPVSNRLRPACNPRHPIASMQRVLVVHMGVHKAAGGHMAIVVLVDNNVRRPPTLSV